MASVSGLLALKAKRDEYIKARTALKTAGEDAFSVQDNFVSSVTAINNGVKVGTTGLSINRLPEYEWYIKGMHGDITTMISHCDTKIDELDQLIKAQELALTRIASDMYMRNKDGVIPAKLELCVPVRLLK